MDIILVQSDATMAAQYTGAMSPAGVRIPDQCLARKARVNKASNL